MYLRSIFYFQERLRENIRVGKNDTTTVEDIAVAIETASFTEDAKKYAKRN